MKRLHRLASTSTIALGLVLASACTSDGDGVISQGGITIAMTDAPSDALVSFEVDVTQLLISRPNGATVDVLAAPVRVDLAGLSDVSRVLGVAVLPPGAYDGAIVTLDLATAQVVIEGNAGPATVLDFSGVPLTTSISLPAVFSGSGIGAALDTNRLLELDFDLNQSLVVDPGGNTVSLEPVLFVRGDPAAPKPLTALGRVQSVDLGAGSFVASVNAPDGSQLASLNVRGAPGTLYQVDGVAALGGAGLTALDALGVGAWIEVVGGLDPSFPATASEGSGFSLESLGTLLATEVHAGTGSFNGGSDIVEGYVSARSSGAGTSADLTVLGSSQDAAHASFIFNGTFTVNTSFANTKVVQAGSAATLDLDDVSIGQRVRVFGSLSGNTLDATAASAVVRLLPTDVFGSANGAPAGSIVPLTLAQVGPRAETDFTWADSGANFPDPANFDVDGMGAEAGLGIVATTVLSSSGIFAPIDDAGPDFLALDVATLDDADAVVTVRDLAMVGHMLSLAPSGAGYEILLTGTIAAGEVAEVDEGFLGASALPASPSTLVLPPLGGAGSYALCDLAMNTITTYPSFSQWSNAVSMALGQGASVRQVTAVGDYDAISNSIQAGSASVCIQ